MHTSWLIFGSPVSFFLTSRMGTIKSSGGNELNCSRRDSCPQLHWRWRKSSVCVCVYIEWEQSVRSDPAQYVLKDELEK